MMLRQITHPASSTSCLPLSRRTTLMVLMPLCLQRAITCQTAISGWMLPDRAPQLPVKHPI